MKPYTLSPGLFKAFKNTRYGARYSEGEGAVPIGESGAMSMVGDANRTPIDEDSARLHERALQIAMAASAHGMSYKDALRLARKELKEKAQAKARGQQFSEVRFAEGGRIPVDRNSILVAKQADAIMAERKISFGEALKMARAEMRDSG